MSIFGINLPEGPRADSEKFKPELLLNITLEDLKLKIKPPYKLKERESRFIGRNILVFDSSDPVPVGMIIYMDDNDNLYASNKLDKEEIEKNI